MARGLSVFINIGARVGSSLPGAIRQTEREFQRLGRSAKLAAAEAKASWVGMQGTFSRFATHVSMPAAAMSGMGMRMAHEWSKVGNELEAVTQMSDKARKGIEAVARSMPGNPTENLSAALDLARTGFTPTQIMGTLPTTIKFGKSDQSVDMAEAADIMTNVMKGMNLPDGNLREVSASANRVANAMAYASAKSSTDLRLMGLSMKYAAPMASRLGMEVEDLAGYFMTMADNGIKGSEAGVALRSGMVRLLKPTKASMAILERYNMRLDDYITASKKATAADVVNFLGAQGIDASRAKGEIAALMADGNLSGAPLIQRITEAVASGMDQGADAADLDKISDGVMAAMTAGVTKLDLKRFIQDGVTKGWTASDFANFFDTRQGTRLMTLWGKDAIRNINAVTAAVNIAEGKGSFLDRMYATQMEGSVGPWEKMKQGFGNLIISMAESGVMTHMANAMNAVANGMMALSKSNPALLKFVTYAILGAAVMAPLGYALSGLGAAFKMVAFVLKPVAGLMLRFGSALVGLYPIVFRVLGGLGGWIIRGLIAAFALLSNPVGWAIILAGVAAALIYYFRDDLGRAWPKVVQWFKDAFAKVKAFILSIDWKGVGMAIADALTFGLASKISGGSWGNILKNATSGFARGGIVGGVVGAVAGKRQHGGPVVGGQDYLVGEAGPELFRAPRSGRIFPAGATAAMAAAAMTPTTAAAVQPSMPVTIIVQGAKDPHAVAIEVRRELARLANGQRMLLSD